MVTSQPWGHEAGRLRATREEEPVPSGGKVFKTGTRNCSNLQEGRQFNSSGFIEDRGFRHA